MGGKASLIVILGFSLIFAIASQYWNRNSLHAVNNLMSYYDTTMAHNIAVSAANLACDSVYFGGWKDTAAAMPNGNFSGGFMHGRGRKVGLYRKAGSYYTTAKRVTWEGAPYLFVTAVGKFYSAIQDTTYDTVNVLFQPKFFSGFAFFTQDENGVNWITGDTLYGPFHTNGNMYISGAPVFFGRATWVKNPTNPFSGGNRPHFYGGWEQGGATYVQIPTDISGIANYASKKFSSSSQYSGNKYAYDVYLTFSSDGTVTETDTTKQFSGGWGGGSWSVVASTPANKVQLNNIQDPYGQVLFVVQDGDVHVQGTLSGDVTIAALQGTSGSSHISYTGKTNGTSYFGSSDGNVIIEGNMTYNNVNADMLGLVADNSVALNVQKNPGNVSIDAAILARQGSFTYLGYNSGSPRGTLDLYGSITQDLRGAVGTFNVGGLATGYLKYYKYDTRFNYEHPPYYPAAPNQFRIISWKE